jgi:hypothetical protein
MTISRIVCCPDCLVVPGGRGGKRRAPVGASVAGDRRRPPIRYAEQRWVVLGDVSPEAAGRDHPWWRAWWPRTERAERIGVLATRAASRVPDENRSGCTDLLGGERRPARLVVVGDEDE